MRIIAGRWGGRRLAPLRGRRVRPTTDRVREAWMSALGGRLDGLSVVDLFAGSGALGLEALSRGAESAVFVERAGSSLRTLRKNVELLDAGDLCTIVQAEAVAWAGALEAGAFDVALADPPYGEGLAARLLESFARVPFATELWVEHRTAEPVPELPGARTRRYGDTTLTTVPAPA